MTLTLLIDLDDTLLYNDINQFQRAYFKGLAAALSHAVTPPMMMQSMSEAVQAMLDKSNPRGTMEEEFDRVFYPGIGVKKSELLGSIHRFYAEEFPKLQPLTQKKDEAANLIEQALGRGWKVVIATNPLFPRTAIEQRLNWAGMAPYQQEFKLVTVYENAHFCKPHPAYYAEILASLGWPDAPAVMVGNSLEDDILPAEKLGFPTFWLDGTPDNAHKRNPLSLSGSFSQILPWLLDIEQKQPKLSFENKHLLVEVLRTTPAAMDSLVRGCSEEFLNRRPAPGEWGINEILCHLRDVDSEVNIPRIETIIAGNNPFLVGVNSDPWAEERNYAGEPCISAFESYLDTRNKLVDTLENIPDQVWSNPARHAIFGPTNLKELINIIATHDQAHIQQTRDVLRQFFRTNSAA